MKSLVLGAEHMAGISDKGRGRQYDMHRAYIVMLNDGWQTEHGKCDAYGFRPVEQPISRECFARLSAVKFPAYVEFKVDHQPGRNGLELLLTDVLDSKPLAAVA